MPNHAGVLQSLFFPAKLETEGDGSIFNTLLMDEVAADTFGSLDEGYAAQAQAEAVKAWQGRQ